MPRHKLTEKHYAVLLAVQDGATDFGPLVEPTHHAAALDLLGHKFGEPMLVGVNSRDITGTTPAGAAALAKHLNQ